jgi:hypothetical protein
MQILQKKQLINGMRCDHFEEFSECDANAKIDLHYEPWRLLYQRLVVICSCTKMTKKKKLAILFLFFYC